MHVQSAWSQNRQQGKKSSIDMRPLAMWQSVSQATDHRHQLMPVAEYHEGVTVSSGVPGNPAPAHQRKKCIVQQGTQTASQSRSSSQLRMLHRLPCTGAQCSKRLLGFLGHRHFLLSHRVLRVISSWHAAASASCTGAYHLRPVHVLESPGPWQVQG